MNREIDFMELAQRSKPGLKGYSVRFMSAYHNVLWPMIEALVNSKITNHHHADKWALKTPHGLAATGPGFLVAPQIEYCDCKERLFIQEAGYMWVERDKWYRMKTKGESNRSYHTQVTNCRFCNKLLPPMNL